MYASHPPGLNKSGVYASGLQDWTSLRCAPVTRLQPFYHGGLIVNVNPLPGFIKHRRWVAAERLWGAPCTLAPSNRIEYLSEEKLRCLSQSCWFRSSRRGRLPHSGLEQDPSENQDLPVSEVFSLDPVQSVSMAFCLTLTQRHSFLCPAQGHQRHKPNPPHL